MELSIGDVTFQKSFAKVGFDGINRVTGTFKAPKGRQFVTLLIGDVDAKSTDCDPEKMLNQLGFFYREQDQ
jgi:hypothetical protein